jgi:hypothetical protein
LKDRAGLWIEAGGFDGGHVVPWRDMMGADHKAGYEIRETIRPVAFLIEVDHN